MNPTVVNSFGFDAQGRYDGTEKYFFAFQEALFENLRASGLYWVINNTIMDPIRPDGAFTRAEAGDPPLPDDFANMRRYQQALVPHHSACERALAIIKRSLGMTPTARVVHILENVTLSDRAKAQQVIALLLATYGINTEATRAAIDNDINNLPIAKDRATADTVLTGLAMLNKILRQMGSAKTDAQLKTILFQKLHGTLFEAVVNEIDKTPDMTYVAACDEVRRVMNLSQMRAVTTSSQVISTANLSYPGYLNPSPPQVTSAIQAMPVPSPGFAFMYPGSPGSGLLPVHSSYSAQPSYQVNTATNSFPSFQPTPCWNCKSTDHRHIDCPANHCRACGSWWPNIHDPTYHHFSVCPRNMNPPNASAINTRRPYARPVAPNKRGRGNFGTVRGRGGGRGGPFGTISALQGPSTPNDDCYTNEYWDNYLAECADIEEHPDNDNEQWASGNINMMCCESSDMPTSSNYKLEQEAVKVLQDSGANICAAPPILAQILNIPVYQWRTPFTVVFGNKSTAISHYYLKLGPILGKVAVVNSCINTILSVSALNMRKYDVLFSRDLHCYVWDKDGNLLIRQPMDLDNRLYYVDVRSFLSPPSLHMQPISVITGMRRVISIPTTDVAQVVKLHDCLHHAASAAVMARAIRYGAWPNVEIDPRIVEQVFLHRDCVPCLLGKLNRLPRSMGSAIHPSAIATNVSVDFKPVSPVAIGGFIGFYLFVETKVLYKIAILTRTHDSNALLGAVRVVHAFFAKYGHRMRYLLPDAGTVEHTKELGIALNELGISIDPAAPECQFQNNAERSIQTIVKGVGSMFAHQDSLPANFWGLALIAHLSACNVCPNSLSGQYSPWYEVTHRHPDIIKRFKYYFGQPVVSVILKQQKHSFAFAPHAEFGYAVGAPEGSNGATLLYIPARGTGKIYSRLDVRPVKLGIEDKKRPYFDIAALSPVFNEDGSVTFISAPTTSLLNLELCRAPWYPSQDLSESDAFFTRDIDSTEITSWTPSSASVSSPETPSHVRNSEGVDNNYDDNIAKVDGSATSDSPRPKRVKRMPNRLSNYIVNQTYATHSDSDMPKLKDAINSDEWVSIWKPACDKEFATLRDMNVGAPISFEDIPPHEPIHPTKMILKKKRDASGMMISAKARLVVIGNWINGVFQSLFAPTVNEKSMKLMFALAAICHLTITGIDIKGAFLYPEQHKSVYISLPSRLTGGHPCYWKLQKTLYGLPESPSAFYKDISTHLLSFGYSRTIADPCMFYKRYPDAGFIMTVVHVDDFAIASSHSSHTEELLSILRQRYTLTLAESLESFLGIHIQYLSDGSVVFTQPKRIDELVAEYLCADVPYPSIPMASSFNDADQNDSAPADYISYMKLLGKLIYIVKTRPDIAYSVNRLATRANHPTIKDFNCLLRIVSYLAGTRDLGIHFKATSAPDAAAATRLSCWVDAAYASHPDSKSHTGYCFSLGGPEIMGMFYSRSFKQTNTTLSSTECENAAAVEATKEIIWLRQLLSELGFPQLEPTIVFADNASMITLAEDYSGNHKRVKHYLTRVNFMIEQVRSKVIHLQHVPSAMNVSDILTKPLGPADFLRLRPLLLGSSTSI